MPSTKPSLDLLRTLTDEHVLRVLMAHGRLTRAEVAALTGISKPTISEGVRRLVASGLVVDTGERSSGRGRAGSYFTLSPASGLALAASITPHGVVAEAVDAFGAVGASAEEALVPGAGPGAVAEALTGAVARLGVHGLVTAVVSAADPVDRSTGRLVQLPDAPFLLGDLDARALLADLVTGPVLVDNDVNWAARAEQALAGAGGDGGRDVGEDDRAVGADVVYLYLDEGLGAAVVSDGQVRRGHSGLAGEIAHLVTTGPDGRAVPLTDVFAALGLRRRDSTAIDVELLLSRIASPDTGGATLRALGAAIGGVVSAVVALLDPALVVAGGAWGSDPRVVAELGRRCNEMPRSVLVRPATVTNRPELTGARAQALVLLRETVVARATGAGRK